MNHWHNEFVTLGDESAITNVPPDPAPYETDESLQTSISEKS
jgi:hypothetical protein